MQIPLIKCSRKFAILKLFCTDMLYDLKDNNYAQFHFLCHTFIIRKVHQKPLVYMLLMNCPNYKSMTHKIKLRVIIIFKIVQHISAK